MHGVVDRKFSNMEMALDRKLENVVEEKTNEIKKTASISSSTWQLPFLFLLVLIIAASVAMWMFYQKIRKMHLL